jgi:hypothetical protein
VLEFQNPQFVDKIDAILTPLGLTPIAPQDGSVVAYPAQSGKGLLARHHHPRPKPPPPRCRERAVLIAGSKANRRFFLISIQQSAISNFTPLRPLPLPAWRRPSGAWGVGAWGPGP